MHSNYCYNSFADGPIDATKLTNPSSSKTTARLTGLFQKDSQNDHGESGQDGGPESGPDPLKAVVESVRLAYDLVCTYTEMLWTKFLLIFFSHLPLIFFGGFKLLSGTIELLCVGDS